MRSEIVLLWLMLHLDCSKLNFKSRCIVDCAWVESEISWCEPVRNFMLLLCHGCYGFLTSTTNGDCLIGLEQDYHCHKVCSGVLRILKGHLWSQDNPNDRCCDSICPCWESLEEWLLHRAVIWCRCSLRCLGNCLGNMAKWWCPVVLWNFLHMHQSCSSSWKYLKIHS